VFPHLVVQEPPQSTSVSSPFLTLSSHAAFLHVGLAALVSQNRLMQSLLFLQPFPVAHLGQVPPPQSVSVSAPFFLLSLQLGFAGMSGLGPSFVVPLSTPPAWSPSKS